MIDPVDRIAERHEPIDQVHVPPAVLGQTVNDKKNRPDLPLRHPSLVVKGNLSDTHKDPFLMPHFPIPPLSYALSACDNRAFARINSVPLQGHP